MSAQVASLETSSAQSQKISINRIRIAIGSMLVWVVRGRIERWLPALSKDLKPRLP